jgi:hypothetical protein
MSTDTAAAMRALAFMAGDWDLDYTVTQKGETTKTLCGTGSLRYLFGSTYLAFDYQVKQRDSGAVMGAAHGIFAWDQKAERYRYFWFEDSGTFLQATAVLRDGHDLLMQWQDINCSQIFRRVHADAMYLEMRCPDEDLLLRVDFSR